MEQSDGENKLAYDVVIQHENPATVLTSVQPACASPYAATVKRCYQLQSTLGKANLFVKPKVLHKMKCVTMTTCET